MMFCCLHFFFFFFFFLQKFLQEHYQSVDRRSVGPDLGPSGLGKSSADDEIDNQQVKS